MASPLSNPARAASTIFSALITVSGGRAESGRVNSFQISVAVEAGRTTWTFSFGYFVL